MSVKERLKSYLKERGISQTEFADSIGVSQGYVNAIRKSIQPDKLKLMKIKYPDLDIDWLIASHEIEHEKPLNSTKEQVLDQLKLVRKNVNKTKVLFEDDVIEVIQYRVPIKGQAGLRKAFFAPDEYIDQNFTKEIIHVKPSERATFYNIEVDGNSMPGTLDPKDWARCEDIPKLYWTEKGTFKPNKIYCLFHRTKGILFKRISKTFLDTITLSSDNADKTEFPDEDFDLAEFSKILIVRVVEKRL